MNLRRLTVGAAALAVVATTVALPAAAAPRNPVHGTFDGFATGDFVYLNLLNTSATDVAQVSVSQSAAAVSNKKLTTGDSLHQVLYAGKTTTKNAYGHAAGVSLNLGQGANTVPQAQLTIADAASPPRTRKSTNIVQVPAAPVATATVQPDVAEANTKSATDFCVLGKPLSQGTADVADAQLVPADQVAKGFALLDATGEVLDRSTEQLVPNGHGTLGLSSSSTLQTAGVTLFKGVPGAATTIKVINPITLDATAGGFPGTAKATFGDESGNKPVVSITNGTNVVKLTLEQLLGNGASIDFDGLLKLDIGLDPTTKKSADGTTITSAADLVKITVIGNPAPSSGTVGGPLGTVLNPVLGPVLDALDNSGLLQQIDAALTGAGLTTAADFRLGHFEVASQVPAGGVRCGLPVHKSVDDNVVHPGDSFTYTITVRNPYDCTLRHVTVDDKIKGSEGLLWKVVSTDPQADTVSDKRVVWDDIGNIKPGEHRSVDVGITIDDASNAGEFTDKAVAHADCGTGSATGGKPIRLTGKDILHAPRVTRGPLPDTGSTPLLALVSVLLVGAGLATRRILARR